MNAQERQVIVSLLDRVQRAAAQAGPRDPEAEAFIQQRLQSFPAAPYHMAQTMVAQERALQQAEQRIGELEQQVRGGSPFAGPAASRFQSQPGYGQQGFFQGGGGGGGFLVGAGQMALGIGGGILLADAAASLLGGGGFGFGGGDEAAYERGYDAGQQDDDNNDDQQASNDDGGSWDDGGGSFDDGGGGDVGGDW